MNSPEEPEPTTVRVIAIAALVLIALLFFTGCVSSRYKAARKDTPPPKLLNVAFAPAPLEASLRTLVTYNGPGSWKRDAFWDEYVVTLYNPGKEPLTVSRAGLLDSAGTVRAPGTKPWALEKESKTLEQKYMDAGIGFVRYTAPGVLIVGAGAGIVAASGGLAILGPTSAGAAAAATATVVALPVYYIAVLTINHVNKVAMEKEFARRRLELPLTLTPGETRTGSLFFPMVPNPCSLGLRWSAGATNGDQTLPLDFLHGLHTAPATRN